MLKRILIKSEIAELPENIIRDDGSTVFDMTSNQLDELQTFFNDPENFYYIVDHFGNLMMKINTNVDKIHKKRFVITPNRTKVLNLKTNMAIHNFIDLLKWLGPLLIILFCLYFSEKKVTILITLILTYFLIVFGSYVRLTDSGLGCLIGQVMLNYHLSVQNLKLSMKKI